MKDSSSDQSDTNSSAFSKSSYSRSRSSSFMNGRNKSHSKESSLSRRRSPSVRSESASRSRSQSRSISPLSPYRKRRSFSRHSRRSLSRDRKRRSESIDLKKRRYRRSKSRDKRRSRDRDSRRRSISRERRKRSKSNDRRRNSRGRSRDRSRRSSSRDRGRWRGRLYVRRKRTPTPPVARRHSRSPRNRDLSPGERDARTVFCMQLSHKVRERDLKEFFAPAGTVTDVRLITCTKTRKFKGIAYIEFSDPTAVPLALNLTGSKLLGIPILVQLTQFEKNRAGNSMPNISMRGLVGPVKLYVSSLHANITEELLRSIFEPFGLIDHIQILTTLDDFAFKHGFINFHYGDDAKRALEQLNGIELAGVPMKLSLAGDDSMGASMARTDTDELDGAGIELGATGRLQLMLKLAEGTGLKIPVAATSALKVPVQSVSKQSMSSSAPPIATQCFMLSNMFDPRTESAKDWDLEIRDDVIEECSKHGEVYHIYVDKDSVEGNVYVKCSTVNTAAKAVNALHGRWFAGRVITAAYVPILHYHNIFPGTLSLCAPLKPVTR